MPDGRTFQPLVAIRMRRACGLLPADHESSRPELHEQLGPTDALLNRNCLSERVVRLVRLIKPMLIIRASLNNVAAS